MAAILIVEDDPSTLERLSEVAANDLSDAIVDTATNYADAIDKAKRSGAAGFRYEAAFIEVRLPEHAGGQSSLNETLRRKLLDQLTHCCVAINLHNERTKTEEAFAFVHRCNGPNAPNPLLIEAEPGSHWHQEAIGLARRAIYGRRVQDALDRLASGEGLQMAGRPNMSARACGSGDYNLNDLMRDLVFHWSDLSDFIQSKARDFFAIAHDPSGKVVSVNVL